METPSSMRRATRSQIKSSVNNIPMSKKNDESESAVSRPRNVKALIDITNDSPIVGLAMGTLETPSSLAKKREQPKKTPGSGEALLRGQVKTLLQKVEEEAEISKISFDVRPSLRLQGALANSPSGLLAPTPANTPQVPNLSGEYVVDVNSLASATSLGVDKESEIHQDAMVIDGSKQETLETEKSLTRSLLFDFIEKSEISESSSCSSVLTFQEGSSACGDKSIEEDDASIWSIQVNASVQDEDEEEEVEREAYDEEEAGEGDYDGYEDGQDGGLVDELCNGLSKIFVQKKAVPEFEGKHTRFVYNSDDEIEGVEEVGPAVSPSALRLKGLPVPEGKHLRFPEEEE